jgi:hypothetical protein
LLDVKESRLNDLREGDIEVQGKEIIIATLSF